MSIAAPKQCTPTAKCQHSPDCKQATATYISKPIDTGLRNVALIAFFEGREIIGEEVIVMKNIIQAKVVGIFFVKQKRVGEENGEKNANNVKEKVMKPGLKPDTMKF